MATQVCTICGLYMLFVVVVRPHADPLQKKLEVK